MINYIRKLRLFVKYRAVSKYYKNITANPLELKTLPGKNICITAPHPDDEIIGCGGVIFKEKDKEKNIHVFYKKPENDVRLSELRDVAEKTGFSYSVTEKKFKHEFKQYLSDTETDIIVLPNFIDNHKDHYKVAQDLYVILKQISFKGKILLYEVWTPHIPNIIVDITEFMKKKTDMLSLYKSQTDNKDYINAVTGLNKYRSLYLRDVKNNREQSYAESFVLLNNPSEYISLFELCTF